MFGSIASRPQTQRRVTVRSAGYMSAADKTILDALAGGISPFTKSFTSTDQAITSAGLLTLPHSLGAIPKFTRYLLVCQTAESGYSIGDLVELSAGTNSSSALDNYNFGAWLDSTNINIRFGSVAINAIAIVNRTTGAFALATNTNWKLRVQAWA